MLQRVVTESRKSRTLKKWLLLATRLLLFFFLILAFAQPFFAKKKALREKETVIYLDNSFSMQAKKGNISLLESAVQELLKNAPQNTTISLFTNNNLYTNTTLKAIQNDLLTQSFTKDQLDLNEINLKAQTLFSHKKNTIKNLILISDFQNVTTIKEQDTLTNLNTHLVKISTNKISNIAIDSVYILSESGETINLNASLFSSTNIENIPVSIYNNDKLIAKTSAIFDKNKKATIPFSLPNKETVLGKIQIEDSGLDYDNTFYFNLNKKEKIKVLEISEVKTNYLSRIFTDDEFEFKNSAIKNLNYSTLESQNIIILNELETIPEVLQKALITFSQNDGSIVVIPHKDALLYTYNSFLNNFSTILKQKITSPQEITTINFDHPLYSNVFNKKITNFQYPEVKGYFPITTNLPAILLYADGQAFLSGKMGIYVFASPLSNDNSSFKNSPLIVPTFYKMGTESLKQEQLYTTLDNTNKVDVTVKLPKDEVLKIVKSNEEFIPQQQPFLNKVTLFFNDTPKEDGIYKINSKNRTLKYISFNFPRIESKGSYSSFDDLYATSKEESITNLFEALEKDDRVNELWKWFVILALLFALTEIGIQKYFK
tara:strand:- start:7100 stop:8905 length:1806 start_codon:yes stop_codon:yes gene_type:complete